MKNIENGGLRAVSPVVLYLYVTPSYTYNTSTREFSMQELWTLLCP